MGLADEMGDAIARWKRSGLSLRKFGEREGLSYWKLHYWRRKLDGAGAEPKTRRNRRAKIELSPVRVVEESPATERGGIEVWLTNGISLEVPAGFHEDELRRLVGVLTTC